MQFVRLQTDNLEKKFTGGYEELKSIKERFFDVRVEKKAYLEFYGIGDIPDPSPFEGLRSYQAVAPGYHIRLEPKEWAGGIVIQRRLWDTDRYDQINNLAKGLGKAAKRAMNKIAHEFVIYMDSSAFSYMIAEEGVALASNSHTSKASVATTAGFDNLNTLPFNATNLEALRIITKGFKSDINERIQTDFDTILHGTNLSEAVWQIVKSEGDVDEINPAIKNFQRGRWKDEELPLWDDYDTNNWAIVDSSMMKDSLVWHQGLEKEVETSSTTDFDNLMLKFGSYFVCGWAWIDWRFFCGCVVA